MEKKRLSLGIDISTQSLTAVALDIDTGTKIVESSLDYMEDPRLAIFGIRKPDHILPPRTDGEADQPPLMFIAALDAILSDLKERIRMADIVVINTSGQQHGHIYLNHNSGSIFPRLYGNSPTGSNLITLLKDSLAYERAPIWMTSNTVKQANLLRNTIGDKERLIKISGSDAQLRFTGLVIRHIAEEFPEVYTRTEIIQLISSMIPAILTGNPHVPVDFGNACGMSLMDYHKKKWSNVLTKAISQDLPGGQKKFQKKLPSIVAPDSIVGKITAYFVHKYGINPYCRIVAGSGDNPQSKVLISGDLLSLGSSFVNMISTDGKTMDLSGAACAMYDGIGRPFMFGCRTNGALVWDQVRSLYELQKEEYTPAEKALQQIPPGHNMVFWQPRDESFPPSGKFEMVRFNDTTANLDNDYAGVIESSLAAVYHHSTGFTAPTTRPLYVTGGVISSPGVLRRIAAIWNKPVIVTEQGGAALGAAVAGASAFFKTERQKFDVEKFSAVVLPRGKIIQPLPEDITAFHSPGGYLDKFIAQEAKLLTQYPLL